MAKNTPLLWQGAAGRKPTKVIAVRIDRVADYKGGLFGIGKSASVVGAFPDPKEISGQTLSEGAPIVLRLPGEAVPQGAEAGKVILAGMVDDEHFICLLPAPADLVGTDLLALAERACT